jgi:hydroxyethylthiazole kinase
LEINEKVIELLSKVRAVKPLVHHITNLVTMNDCANITAAIGASPIMAFDRKEVEEIVAFSNALVINIGTIQEELVDSILLAGKKANELSIPIILDPVGIGATKLRYETVNKLINTIGFSVIRGNMSEIKTLAGFQVETKGVDSATDNFDAAEIAKRLARKLNTVIAITGKVDIVSDGQEVYSLANGHEMLTRVSGTGCMSTSLIGSYSGVTTDYLAAAIGGIITMSISGELAYKSLKDNEGVGTFKTRIFDSVYNMNGNLIRKEGKIKNE